MHTELGLLHKTPLLQETPQVVPHVGLHLSQSLVMIQLRVVHAGAYFAPQGKDFPLHTHTVWELHYYRAGKIDTVIEGERFEVQPGMVTLVPPNVIHGEKAWTDYANYYIQIAAPANMRWPRVFADDVDQSLSAVCAACVREITHTNVSHRDEMLDALSAQLDVLLRRACGQTGVDNVAEQLVRQVESILEERYATSLCIKEVAWEIGVSPSHLRAQFKKLRGISPMNRLQEIRVQRALGWLRHSNLTLESIAHTCGYDSASHLSRHVKRAIGCSPGALREVAR